MDFNSGMPKMSIGQMPDFRHEMGVDHQKQRRNDGVQKVFWRTCNSEEYAVFTVNSGDLDDRQSRKGRKYCLVIRYY